MWFCHLDIVTVLGNLNFECSGAKLYALLFVSSAKLEKMYYLLHGQFGALTARHLTVSAVNVKYTLLGNFFNGSVPLH